MNSPPRTSSPPRIAYRAGVPGTAPPSAVQALAEVMVCQQLREAEGVSELSWPEFSGLILAGPPSLGPLAADEGFIPAGFSLDPELPVSLDTDLDDRETQEQFLDLVLGYRDVRDLFREGWRIADLVAFNVRERFRVIGHDPKKHTLIGRLVAKAKDHPREFLETEIASLFLSALAKPMTRRKHVNVLEHIADFVAPRIDALHRDSLAESIASYGRGQAPRRVPLTLLRAYVEETGIAGLRAQSYLYPDPVLLRFLELG